MYHYGTYDIGGHSHFAFSYLYDTVLNTCTHRVYISGVEEITWEGEKNAKVRKRIHVQIQCALNMNNVIHLNYNVL